MASICGHLNVPQSLIDSGIEILFALCSWQKRVYRQRTQSHVLHFYLRLIFTGHVEINSVTVKMSGHNTVTLKKIIFKDNVQLLSGTV